MALAAHAQLHLTPASHPQASSTTIVSEVYIAMAAGEEMLRTTERFEAALSLSPLLERQLQQQQQQMAAGGQRLHNTPTSDINLPAPWPQGQLEAAGSEATKPAAPSCQPPPFRPPTHPAHATTPVTTAWQLLAVLHEVLAGRGHLLASSPQDQAMLSAAHACAMRPPRTSVPYGHCNRQAAFRR